MPINFSVAGKDNAKYIQFNATINDLEAGDLVLVVHPEFFATNTTATVTRVVRSATKLEVYYTVANTDILATIHFIGASGGSHGTIVVTHIAVGDSNENLVQMPILFYQ